MSLQTKLWPTVGFASALTGIFVPVQSYAHYTSMPTPGIGAGFEHVLVNPYHAGTLFVAGFLFVLLVRSPMARRRPPSGRQYVVLAVCIAAITGLVHAALLPDAGWSGYGFGVGLAIFGAFMLGSLCGRAAVAHASFDFSRQSNTPTRLLSKIRARPCGRATVITAQRAAADGLGHLDKSMHPAFQKRNGE